MGRVVTHKQLTNSRLLKDYASWMYCSGCDKTIGYLCYVTYDEMAFDYHCHCGNHGRIVLCFDHEDAKQTDQSLHLIKNRWCCPEDDSPLITILDQNLSSYRLKIVCNHCHNAYIMEKNETDLEQP